MSAIGVPDETLLGAHARAGAYVDAYATEVARTVDLAQFLRAFYATPLFRVERLVLALAVRRPSTDGDLRRLADGAADHFAAWRVEARRDDQILLAAGRTRSWLRVMPHGAGTRLCFGSAVLPGRDGRMGGLFAALLGFHRLYSRLLLSAARRRLLRDTGGAPTA